MVIGQALTDLESLKLRRLGSRRTKSSRVPQAIIAGIPRYVGIFARDTLITGWQSSLFDPQILKDAIQTIGELQGSVYDPWRDEEPGRLPHECRINPDSLLGENNREIYFGDVTSTPFYCIALAKYFRWTGDRKFLRSQTEVLRGCCKWMLRKLEEGCGLIYYQPALSGGAGANRNQAWKDSGDAIVDEHGRICVPPIALVEIQGYAYEALCKAAELFLFLGDGAFSIQLSDEATRLKKKFNIAFWDPREKFFALALKREGEVRIAARASNIGHCLGTGIIRRDRVAQVVRFLLSPDLFSGWGIRTLSNLNPGYDPFSYHRGSVWPVENGEIAARLNHLGYGRQADQIVASQFALATLFPHFRLPEVVSGHTRSRRDPLPGLYPFANLLQAWSASAPLQMLESYFGFQANALEKKLKINARLPDWMDHVILENLQFAGGRVSLDVRRLRSGRVRTTILKCSAGLKISFASSRTGPAPKKRMSRKAR